MALPQTAENAWTDAWDWRLADVRDPPAQAARPVRRYPSGPDDIARLLHIEPLRAARRILRITLTHPRIALTQVETGEAAVEMLAIKPFDLVLLSMSLRDMSAAETLAWVRRSVTPWSDIPVIGLRDMRQRERLGDFMAFGLSDWAWRPVDRVTINAKIIALLPALHDAGL